MVGASRTPLGPSPLPLVAVLGLFLGACSAPGGGSGGGSSGAGGGDVGGGEVQTVAPEDDALALADIVPGGTTSEASGSAPEVSWLNPAATAWVTGTVPLLVSAKDPQGISEVRFVSDGGPIGTATSQPWQVDWDTTAEAPGPLNISATAVDTLGDERTIFLLMRVDQDVPAVTILAPAAGTEIHDDQVTLSAEASDASEVFTVRLEAPGAADVVAEGPPWSGTLNLTGSPSGTIEVSAVALDATGTEGSASVPVFVDHAPWATLLSVTSGSVLAPSSGLAFTAGDDFSLEIVRLHVDGDLKVDWEGEELGPAVPGGPALLNVNLGALSLSEGSHTLTVEAEDGIGRTAASSASVTLDWLAPELSVAIRSCTGAGCTALQPGQTLSGTHTLEVGVEGDIEAITKVTLGTATKVLETWEDEPELGDDGEARWSSAFHALNFVQGGDHAPLMVARIYAGASVAAAAVLPVLIVE